MFQTQSAAYCVKIGTGLARVSFLFLILCLASNFRREDYKSVELKVYPNASAALFSLGYKDPLADTILIKLLLNFDFCETTQAKSVNSGNSLNAILNSELTPSRCHLGWVYQWADLLTNLAPRFKSTYDRLGMSLSILVDDREGARRIFEKGLHEFPKDWVLNYRASYHYLYEMQNPQRAAELMMIAYKNGGPHFLPALAAQLYTRMGQAAFAKSFLEEFIEQNPESADSPQIKKRLQEATSALSFKK